MGYWRYRRWVRGGGGNGAWVSAESVVAFVLTPEGRISRVELGSAQDIDEAIDRWYAAHGALRSDLRRRGGDVSAARSLSEAQARDAGERLRALVFDPVWEAAGGELERVVVALDDSLHLVPLDALPKGEGVLGDEVVVERRVSLGELLEGKEPPGEGRFLGVGAVDFDAELGGASSGGPEKFLETPSTIAAMGAGFGSASSRAAARAFFPWEASWSRGEGGVWKFQRLPETGEEVRRVASLYVARFGGSPELLEGAGASKGALLALAGVSRFLHVATHAYVASEEPWRALDAVRGGGGPRAATGGLGAEIRELAPSALCGLALAGANRTAEGLLTAEELSTVDLSGCDLATLSACSTYAGVLRRVGQGLASLQRALHVAGVRASVTSLWPVADDAARELMEGFYRRVWERGEAKGRALWAAKMALREKRDASGHPVYAVADWAGWVLTGDPE